MGPSEVATKGANSRTPDELLAFVDHVDRIHSDEYFRVTAVRQPGPSDAVGGASLAGGRRRNSMSMLIPSAAATPAPQVLSAGDMQRVRHSLDQSVSENTRALYASASRFFQSWTQARVNLFFRLSQEMRPSMCSGKSSRRVFP